MRDALHVECHESNVNDDPIVYNDKVSQSVDHHQISLDYDCPWDQYSASEP